MDLIISMRYVPKRGFALPRDSGAIKLPSCLAHLLVKALVSDGLVPLQRAPEVLALLKDLDVITLEKAASLLPSPFWEAIEYVASFFYSPKETYAFVPGLPNVSLISLLSVSLGSGERCVLPWSPALDERLLSAVDRLARVCVLISQPDMRLIARAETMFVGPDANVSVLSLLRKVLPATATPRRGCAVSLSPLKVEEVEWEKWTPQAPVPRRRRLNLLKVFGENADAVAKVLDECAKVGSARPLERVMEDLETLGASRLVVYDLIRYGFLTFGAGSTVMVTTKGIIAVRRWFSEKEKARREAQED